MRKMDRLIKEARESCAFRQHNMARFSHKRHNGMPLAYSWCKDCGMGVSVKPLTMPDEIEIGGEAVALHCDKGNK